jgi:hypothetical protein
MTLEEAKFIIKTYKLPMSSDEMQRYKLALKIVAGSVSIIPE